MIDINKNSIINLKVVVKKNKSFFFNKATNLV